MWYKVKLTRDIEIKPGKQKHSTEYYLVDDETFAAAGYKALEYAQDGEVEDVCLLKSYKPLGNIKYAETCKVFIVKFAEDFTMEDGSIKTQKYPVPFFANDNTELQKILELYIKQGLENMRIISVTETNWVIL